MGDGDGLTGYGLVVTSLFRYIIWITSFTIIYFIDNILKKNYLYDNEFCNKNITPLYL